MDIRLQRLETFVVHDHHGNTYTVHAYERLARVHILHDPERAWEPTGVAEYRLDSGEHLQLERDGGFRVAESGLRLARKAQQGKPALI